MLPGHLQLDVQPQQNKTKKSPTWKCLLETHLSFQILVLFAGALIWPSPRRLFLPPVPLPPTLGRGSQTHMPQRKRTWVCKVQEVGWKWHLTFASVLGSNRTWWGQWRAGGQGPHPTGGSSWLSCHVGMWAQCYQISLFSKRMWNQFIFYHLTSKVLAAVWN